MKGLYLNTILVIFALMVAGCGYHVAGRGTKIEGIDRLAIPVFKNSTQKPDIESIITTAVVDEFVNIVEVVETDVADAVLNGRVLSYELKPISYSERDVVEEYRLSVLFSFELVSQPHGRVLWRDNISDYEDFQIDSTSVTGTKQKELDAFKKIARDTARLLKERILEEVY